MEKLIIGIDLDDTGTQVAVCGKEETWNFPTVICRKKTAEEWYVGEDAYKYTLVGEGVMVDKLLSLATKDGTATIGGIKYGCTELLQRFFELILKPVFEEYKELSADALVISLNHPETKLMERIFAALEGLGIPRHLIHIAGSTECFVYYVLNQRRDVWGGSVGMFFLTDGDLRYYEMKATRGTRQLVAIAEKEELEEGFDLNVLDTSSGAKMADKILSSCGERFLQKKTFSSVFLTGKGFLRTDWACGFMKQVCSRRRVFAEPALFAKGAAMKGEEYVKNGNSCPFVCICEGKIRSTVSIEVMKREVRTELVLASAGENWYEAKSIVDVILDDQDEISFTITPKQDPKAKRTVTIPLEGFPNRPPKTTKVRIALGFMDEKTMVVKLSDRGFGELFPSSDTVIRQEVMI